MIFTTQTDEAVLVAAIDVSILARTTGPIIYNRLDRNSCAHRDVVYAFANLFYHAAELMTQCQWCFLIRDGMGSRRDDTGTPKVLMQVCDIGVNMDLGLDSRRLTCATYSHECWSHLV